ncbi:MAG: hypothetical protein WCD45_10095 [Gallionella sp.]
MNLQLHKPEKFNIGMQFFTKNFRGYTRIFIGILCLDLFLSTSAVAAPEEIQVYLDEFENPGQYGLDLHSNYVVAGQPATDKQLRLTPEFSYGLNNNWEVGAYVLTAAAPGGAVATDGIKFRAKWRPRPASIDTPFYWAVNFEAGQLSKRFYPDELSSELKLIGVWKNNYWTVGTNLNFDRSLKSNPIQATSTEFDTKIAYQVRNGLQIGVENYSFLGAMHNDPSQPQSNQANYLVADLMLGKWDLNVGLGHVSGPSPDGTVIKAIIGFPLD